MMEFSDEKLKLLKSSIPKEIGNRVRHFRKEKGYTQTELAQIVGKDRQYLYKIEKGKVTPNVVTIAILAMALEIPLKDLFDFDEKSTTKGS
ncbi:helix-turn-helix domain-containing protein [Hwangdonia lutea]|uniref:Helix-turn-helix transcriptional regulator n=1 Tax=Hwangdonia lutea TaxID=3075823 RepID=A0AA97EPE7_9FLAO|nr:helix-turn-helix transcriptional regulator [Hwangdonia sp. SCSIO 19198]WOD44932.1 helix-turn-helix transcriptional regulator [Hwangdonia sp. SCSIO 19198]